jgi:hypothetical protein
VRNRLAGRRQDRPSGEPAKPLRVQSSLLKDQPYIQKEFFMPMTDYADENPATGEIELNVEELEEVIAPKLATNHNETLVNDEVELAAEEMEEVIAPILAANHNETIVNDEVELNVEELEETIAPTPSIPIPPPLR